MIDPSEDETEVVLIESALETLDESTPPQDRGDEDTQPVQVWTVRGGER